MSECDHSPQRRQTRIQTQLSPEMAAAAPRTTFSDHSEYKDLCYRLRVDELKHVIRELNQRTYSRLSVSGNKAILQSRILNDLQTSVDQQDEKLYACLKEALDRAYLGQSQNNSAILFRQHQHTSSAQQPLIQRRSQNDFDSTTTRSNSTLESRMSPSATTTTTTTTATSWKPPYPVRAGAPTYSFPQTSLASSSTTTTTNTNNPYSNASNGSHPPPPPSHIQNATSSRGTNHPVATTTMPITFVDTPFYRVDMSISPLAVASKAGPGERKNVTCTFTLPFEARTKMLLSDLNANEPQYQLRFFVTSEEQASPALTHLRTGEVGRKKASIEFPSTCEIKLNDCVVPCNTKGIKRQPGTAQPVELSKATLPVAIGFEHEGIKKALNLNPNTYNRVQMVYVNTEKRYHCCVMLIEYFSADKLLKKCRSGKKKSKEEVITENNKIDEDDDVKVSSAALDLRDPLSMMRIKEPIRSTQCSHLQCFDAETFFTVMECTPTWKCPVCNRVLQCDDLFIDGYSQDILSSTPNSIESVIVEQDGTWHDEKNQFGNFKNVVATQQTRTGASSLPSPAPTNEQHNLNASLTLKRKSSSQPFNQHNIVLDDMSHDDEDDNDEDEDEDEDEGTIDEMARKRQRIHIDLGSSPIHIETRCSSSTSANLSRQQIVIDLTNDD